MKKIIWSGVVAVVLMLTVISCKKESEIFPSAPLNDYYPLQEGRSFLYRADSTVDSAHGGYLVTKSYQALDTVESSFTDNEGRLSFRIFRYLRDTLATQPWTYAYTFMATQANNQIEYVEDNFRFIKLHSPVRNDFSWQGNSYIETKSDNTYLDGWNYSYSNVNEKYTTAGITYDSTITVMQQDDFSPAGPFDPNYDYQQRNYSIEVYAKGIGLIYKDFLHWTWQKPIYEDGSYGIRLQLISHN